MRHSGILRQRAHPGSPRRIARRRRTRRWRAGVRHARFGKLHKGFSNPTKRHVDYLCSCAGALWRRRCLNGSDILKKAIFGAAVAAVLSVAATAAFADQAPAPPPGVAQMHGAPERGDGPPSHHEHGPMMGPRGPGFAVINDLEQLRRLYAMSGHEGEIIAVYHDVLSKTQDPMLRHYVYESLAREQLKPANPEQAIATLRTSLAEDLAAANKPHGAPGAPPPPVQPQ
jgi:hypothetical protein